MKLKEFKAPLYPSIKKLDIFVKKNIMDKIIMGKYVSQIKRKGIEFAGYRTYTSSDDAGQIDWKASLRSQKLLIKETTEEKSINVFFLVDVSNSMLFSTTDFLKCECTAEMVSSFSHALIKGGDAAGMGMFADSLKLKFHPMTGLFQYSKILTELRNVENYGGEFHFTEALKYLLAFLDKKSIIVVISDFIGMGEGWQKYIEILAQKFFVIGIMIRDPLDRHLPHKSSQLLIEDPDSHQRMIVDTAQYAHIYENFVQQDETEIKLHLEKVGVHFLALQTDDECFTRQNLQMLTPKLENL